VANYCPYCSTPLDLTAVHDINKCGLSKGYIALLTAKLEPHLAGDYERLEAENRELAERVKLLETPLRTIEQWPFNIMGDCVADARQLARAALAAKKELP